MFRELFSGQNFIEFLLHAFQNALPCLLLLNRLRPWCTWIHHLLVLHVLVGEELNFLLTRVESRWARTIHASQQSYLACKCRCSLTQVDAVKGLWEQSLTLPLCFLSCTDISIWARKNSGCGCSWGSQGTCDLRGAHAVRGDQCSCGLGSIVLSSNGATLCTWWWTLSERIPFVGTAFVVLGR